MTKCGYYPTPPWWSDSPSPPKGSLARIPRVTVRTELVGAQEKKHTHTHRPDPQGWWLRGWKMNEKAFPFFCLCCSNRAPSNQLRPAPRRGSPSRCYFYRINILIKKKKYFPAPRLGVDVRRQPWIRSWKKTPDLCHAMGLQARRPRLGWEGEYVQGVAPPIFFTSVPPLASSKAAENRLDGCRKEGRRSRRGKKYSSRCA